MDDLRAALDRAVEAIVAYRGALPEARVTPRAGRAAVREALDRRLQDGPVPAEEVVEELLRGAEPGLMASSGPRYFGFVIGGALDAALAADVLAIGWDQAAYNEATSPASLAFEDVAGGWLKELLGIPVEWSVGYVTGAQAGNTVGLAAARWHALRARGWDVGRDGLNGAPRLHVLAGAERHATIDRALRLLGLGDGTVVSIPVDANGAMDADALHAALADLAGEPTIVCAQAGNVNTGACDPLRRIGEAARAHDVWLHVDGAFGLWAGASPRTAHLVDGLELADSASCDGHKWLNVPYDVGFAFCRHPDAHATALAYTAAYLTGQVAGRELGGGDFVPESSRRARGFATWAALRSLGRSGVADLVDRCCALARRCADGLGSLEGVEVVNDVVLNQVLVRVGDEEVTARTEREIQQEGAVWLGGTTWRGERLLRISVSNWSTTERDVDVAVEAVARARRLALGSVGPRE